LRLSEQRLPFPDPPEALPEPRVDQAYFDADNRPRWYGERLDARAVKGCAAPTPADTAGSRAWRRARLARPRVDEQLCPDLRHPGRSRKALVGLDAQGRVAWERPLSFRSGPADIEQWLVGATSEALVLSNLEVWSPATGETLVPARTHASGPDGRPVPDHHFSTSALYLPSRREFLVFEADVTLLRREGGLYRIGANDGRKELWLPITTTLIGTYDRVESMALSSDGRFALLGLRQEVRGPASVAVAVLDLTSGQRVFEERFGSGRTCSDTHVVAGRDGHFAFSYSDASARELVLMHFQVRP